MNDVPTPSQDRSRRALERFLNAAVDVLASNEFEGTGIAQLAKLASSSVGTFYRLFGDKDALLLAVHQRFVNQAWDRTSSLADELEVSPVPLDEKICSFILGVYGIYKGSEGLIRALIVRSSSDPGFRGRIHQLNSHVCETFTQVLLAHQGEMSHPNPQQAIDLSAHMLLANMNYLSLVGSLGSIPREDIPGEFSRLICCYLGVELTSTFTAKLGWSEV